MIAFLSEPRFEGLPVIFEGPGAPARRSRSTASDHAQLREHGLPAAAARERERAAARVRRAAGAAAAGGRREPGSAAPPPPGGRRRMRDQASSATVRASELAPPE